SRSRSPGPDDKPARPRARACRRHARAVARGRDPAATDEDRGRPVTAAPAGRAHRHALVLAVDGGNFKTDLALLDASGGRLSLVRGGGSSPHKLGVAGCVEVLEGLLESAIARAGLDRREGPPASTAYLLLAGADEPEERATLRARIEQMGWSERLVVDN